MAANSGSSRISLDAQGDPDGDGFDNLTEFAFGFDPTVPNPPLSLSPRLIEQAGQRYLSIRYQRNRWATQFLNIGVERSTDLGTGDSWSAGEVTEMSATPVGPMVDEVLTRSNSPMTGQNSEFLRVQAEKAAP